jgi:hypothetical protein
MTPAARFAAALAAGLTLVAAVDDADARTRRNRERPEPVRVPAAERLDLSTPDGAVAAMRRIWCSSVDGAPSYWHWRGEAFARRQGERDKALFRVEGLNVRTCVAVNDPVRGPGVRTLSRELLIYVDPQSGRPLTTWANPWTGETVDVVQVANDPVNGAFFPRGPDGQRTQWRGQTIGDQWFLTTTAPLFYDNPLGGEFQAEIGGAYHATEMFNFSGEMGDLLDTKRPGASVRVGWVRLSDWLPWMKMGGREGIVYMHLAGRKLARWDDVSPMLRAEVDARYPAFRTPPPLDDARPNETSLSSYKKRRAAQAAAAAAGGQGGGK